jgi:hypothetical protein
MPFISITYPPKYPLTDSEKKWLEGKSEADCPAPCVRTGKRGLFDMRYCLKACEGNRASSPKYCPIASDFRDAAEFEARVAAKLTSGTSWYFYDENCHLQVSLKKNRFLRLKHARLAVEEEMS